MDGWTDGWSGENPDGSPGVSVRHWCSPQVAVIVLAEAGAPGETWVVEAAHSVLQEIQKGCRQLGDFWCSQCSEFLVTSHPSVVLEV